MSMQDGATVKYVFAANKVSVDDVARVFGQIFGERFTNTLA